MAVELKRSQVVAHIRQWLADVVIGLNLCPFAAEPLAGQQLRIRVSDARTEDELLTDIQAELMLLDRMHPDELDTTILAIPYMLKDFNDYNECLYLVTLLLREFSWDRDYQVATFHPRYQFEGTDPDDIENLTNRSPYPLLHILRESSVSEALATYKHPERIPKKNVKTVRGLSQSEKEILFPYLYKPSPKQSAR